MSAASFLDSNVLIYTDDHDAPEKQAIALSLVEVGQANRDTFVSTQVLEEYFSAATKKLRVAAELARGKVELFAQLNVVLITVDDVLAAIDLHRLHHVSFWDALLVQSARRAGCTTLLTEDLQDGRRFDGVVVRNPFQAAERG
ncbi:MAG: PIN domain-containing protein [Luteitalea sp.]|nr:PIN domain-containing protein [Luteitalea sp.]